ncbi:hypothetical protein CPB86DRAFT_270631 [Serendipita vermifera]|nr:hypothetical protein CPB86DRAFT_270631 [Serendipita vermifera]
MAEENRVPRVQDGYLYGPLESQNSRDTIPDSSLDNRDPATSQNNVSRSLEYPFVTTGPSTRYLKRVLVHSSGILLVSLGIGGILLFYLFKHKIEWDRQELITLVPQGNVLLITAVASKAVLTTSPLVMGIAAYYIADVWTSHTDLVCGQAKSSKHGTSIHTQDLPTPFQYALILKIFQGASIFSFWNTLRYFLRSRPKRRQSTSKPLTHSFFILIIILFLSYSLMAIDFALHSQSVTRFLSVKGDLIPLQDSSSQEASLYGRKLKGSCYTLNTNGTACTTVQRPPFWEHRYSASYEEGYRTLVGLSNSTKVEFAPLETSQKSTVQVALLTAANTPPEVSFTASTVGVYTKCSSVAPYCDMTPDACNLSFHPTNLTHSTMPDNTFAQCIYIPCTKPGWPLYWIGGFSNLSTFTLGEPLEMRNEPEVADEYIVAGLFATDQNPFRFFSTLTLYIDPSSAVNSCAEYSTSTGRCIRGTDDAFLYSGHIINDPTPLFRLLPLGCSVNIINAEYTYVNGSYSIDPSTVAQSDNSTTLAVSSVFYTNDAPLSFVFDTTADISMEGESSEVVISKFEESVSQLLASMAQGAFDPIPITQQSRVTFVAATVLPTPLIVAFFGLLIAHAILVGVLTGLAGTVSKEAIRFNHKGYKEGDDGYKRKQTSKNLVELARRRLCEPASLVYELFESQGDSKGRWMKGAGIEMFEEGLDDTTPVATGGREDEAFIGKPKGTIRMRVVEVGIQHDGGFGFSTE